MRWKVVLVLFIIFNLLDAGLTVYGIRTGIFYEANPLVAVVIARIGLFWAFVLLKGLACAGGIFIFYAIKRSPSARWALLFCTVAMFSVVTYSVLLLASAG